MPHEVRFLLSRTKTQERRQNYKRKEGASNARVPDHEYRYRGENSRVSPGMSAHVHLVSTRAVSTHLHAYPSIDRAVNCTLAKAPLIAFGERVLAAFFPSFCVYASLAL